jgi:thiaminase/transcriptional activator TenA
MDAPGDLLAERLRAECGQLWERLHGHPFIRELAAGTLPPDAFRFYLEQNLQYLPEYARTIAAAAGKADDLATMRLFADDLRNILESEIPENEELLRRVIELGARDLGGALAMAPANVAYTGFLVSTAVRGGPLEIMAAILPCTWSYGDIGARLAPEVREHPVYAEWVRFFGSPDYGEIVAKMRSDFELLAAGASDATIRRLSELFTTSVRLERGFWDMAYGIVHWPDVAARAGAAAQSPTAGVSPATASGQVSSRQAASQNIHS